MNEQEIKNLKLLVSKLDIICLSFDDYLYIVDNLKDVYSPFHSDMMIDVVKKGCLGRFMYTAGGAWAGHCFVRKSVKPGYFKISMGSQDVGDILWINSPKWSKNFNLADDESVERAICLVTKFNNLKAFW